METSVKQLENSKVELTVTADAREVDAQIKAAYKEAAKARIPGFRPGKAPRSIVENHYGGNEYFLASATDELMNSMAPLAIDACGLVPLGKTEFNDDVDMVVEGAPFTFTLSMSVAPQLELSSYEPVKIELPSTQASEAEIEEHINALREYYVEYEDVGDRGAKQGDVLLLSIKNSTPEAADKPERDDESDAEPLTQESAYELGSNVMPEGFEKGLKGMKAGETKDVTFSFDTGSEDATPEEHTMTVTLKALQIKKLPELNDEWVQQTIEFEDVADLKSRVAESIKTSKEADLPPLREMLSATKLAERLQGLPSDEMIKQTEQSSYQDLFKSLQDNRMTFDQYLASRNLTSETFHEQMHEQAVQNSAIELALDALARHLKLDVSEDEVVAEFEKAGAPDPKKLHAEWKKQGRISEIREGLLRIKAARHLYDTAEVCEPGTLKEDKPKSAKAAAGKAAAKKSSEGKNEGTTSAQKSTTGKDATAKASAKKASGTKSSTDKAAGAKGSTSAASSKKTPTE